MAWHLSDGWDVVDAMARAVIVTDDDGVVRAFNPAACELYGWSSDEAIGRSIVELLSLPDRIDDDASDLAAVASGVERAGDRWVRRRDGVEVLVQTATRPIHDASGDVIGIVGISEDVTDRRRSEAYAERVMLQHRTALAAGALGTWHWDAVAGSVAWDEQLECLFGLPAGGFDGTFETYVALLHPDDRARVLASVDEAMRTGSNYRVEHRIVRPDGEVRWIRGAASVIVDEAGTSIGTVGCASDVTAEVDAAIELRRLNTLAVDAAQRERLQRERLEFIGRVNDALADSVTVHDVMTRVTRTLVPGLGTWCSLFVLDDSGGTVPSIETWHVESSMVEYARQLQARFPYDPDAAHGVPAVIRERRREFVPEVDASLLDALNLTDELRTIVDDLGLSSSIAVPLVKGGRVLGALQIVTAHESRRFADDDVALAEALASRIAATIDNIRLREKARTTSLVLQESLLPGELPDIPGVELAVRYWPAGEGAVVGGDFYDVFALTDARWAVMIGDVCGTGPRAAALTGLARHTARDAAWHGDRPDEVLLAVHRAVRRSGATTFVTAIYGEIDLSGPHPQITVAVGGHPLPLLGRDGTMSAIGGHGTLLGFVEEPQVSTSVHGLEAGDVVVLYTDGATDLHPPHMLTSAEFEHLVSRCTVGCGSADSIAGALGDAFDAIQPFEQRNDDVAVIVLRLSATSAVGG